MPLRFYTSLVPRPRPAFLRLQYGKAIFVRARGEPGNEAIYILEAGTAWERGYAWVGSETTPGQSHYLC